MAGFASPRQELSAKLGIPGQIQPTPVSTQPGMPPQVSRYSSQSETVRDQDKTTDRQVGVINQPVYEKLLSRLESDPAIQGQTKNLMELKEKLNAFMESPKEVDLTPLMQMGDFYTGGRYKLAEKYKPGMSEKDRIGFTQKLAGLVQKAHNDLSKAQNNFFKSQLLNYVQTGTVDSTSKTTGGGSKTAPPKDPGGKTLSQTSATEFADIDAAIEMLDNLWAEWKKADALNPASRSEYDAAMRPVMQAVGTILEGGKLAAGDEPKYKKMMPNLEYDASPLGAPEKKMSALKEMLEIKRKERMKKFKESGYKTPSASGGGGEKEKELTPEQRKALGI